MKGSYNGYNDYFNFGLNTVTWRLFVNKQILMRYERLFIERQLNDVANESRYLKKQKEDLKNEIDKIKRDKEIIKNRMSGGGGATTGVPNVSHPP